MVRWPEQVALEHTPHILAARYQSQRAWVLVFLIRAAGSAGCTDDIFSTDPPTKYYIISITKLSANNFDPSKLEPRQERKGKQVLTKIRFEKCSWER